MCHFGDTAMNNFKYLDSLWLVTKLIQNFSLDQFNSDDDASAGQPANKAKQIS